MLPLIVAYYIGQLAESTALLAAKSHANVADSQMHL